MKSLTLPLIVSCALCGANELEKPKQNFIEIYQNDSFLTQTFSPDSAKFSVEIPATLDLGLLEIKSECELENLGDSGIYEIKSDERKRLEEALAKVVAQKKAIQAKIEFSKSLASSGSGNADEFYMGTLRDFENIAKLQADESALNEQIARTPSAQMRHANLSFACAPKSVALRYAVFLNEGASAKISADTEKQKLTITQSIRVKNPLNSALDALSVTIYPYAYSALLAPRPFQAQYIGGQTYEADGVYMQKAMLSAAPRAAMSNHTVQATNAQLTLSNSYTIENLSIAPNESAKIDFDKQILEAKFSIFIDAYSQNLAFLQAKTKLEKPLNHALTTIEIDRVNAGQDWREEIPAGVDTSVFLGQNRLIKVTKKIDEKNTKENFFGTKKTTISSWNYEVKNTSARAWDIELLAKMPLSADEKVKITDKSGTKADNIDTEGRASWKFRLNNGETKTINFGYEISDARSE
ncbi:DUF4139 domain-containing protein [Campylobacter sp. JMF_06 NA1]|uniref:DUF4139 domain-containing protein n=1 Tax=Campylobacter sp. JMF_06 NA1 TaxID=2983823 RepID=UPI0022E9CC6C|nr:DUF4139 domain-containing protein [Campylobacter sp. JMF_06 NA1]MDA3077795.1 DUF4139 domain-containing protein [Campylobacter sp. JMF_06 NA1]